MLDYFKGFFLKKTLPLSNVFILWLVNEKQLNPVRFYTRRLPSHVVEDVVWNELRLYSY